MNNTQSESRSAYAGKDELWAGERYLINYNRDLIKKLIAGNEGARDVLEFGAGIGTLAQLWVSLTQVKPDCVEVDEGLRSVLRGRGFHCYDSTQIIEKKFDVIYTSNVLEHIDNDLLALCKLSNLLKSGGSLIIYVPAFPILYSDLDQKVGHYRRYRKSDLCGKLNQAGFQVFSCSFSDSLGFLAWLFIKMRGYREGQQSVSEMKFYDRYIFPLSLILDSIGGSHFIGKNILVRARKV